MSCGVGHRCGSSDLVLLWQRPVAVTPIRPPAWKPQYASGAVLKKKKKKKKKEKKKRMFTKLRKIIDEHSKKFKKKLDNIKRPNQK